MQLNSGGTSTKERIEPDIRVAALNLDVYQVVDRGREDATVRETDCRIQGARD